MKTSLYTLLQLLFPRFQRQPQALPVVSKSAWAPLRRTGALFLVMVAANVGALGMSRTAEPLDASVAAALRMQATKASAGLISAFYSRLEYAPVWTQLDGPTPEAQAALQLLTQAQRFGLKPAEYNVVLLQTMLDSLTQGGAQSMQLRVRTEHQITAALLRFAYHLHDGRITDPNLRPAQLAGEPIFDAVAHLQQAVRSGNFTEYMLTAQPTSRSYVRLVWAWQRLLQTDSVAAERMALSVALNLERLRWEPRADSLYLAVNIPAYSLQVVRGAKVVATHRVVVGKTATPTPELFSRLTFFQAAPEWRVPQSISANEMLPKLRRDPSSLTERGFELFTAAGKRVNPYRVNWKQVQPETFAYQIRQLPSADNALGNVVFRFANPYSIYLHDTPTKAAFRATNRALSHGCIRVEKPLELARFLLQRDNPARADDRAQDLQTSLNRSETKGFGLQAPVPLLVRYLTCEADGDRLRVLPDIYGRDQALTQAWQGEAVAPAALALR
ncbi:L,D-transpeptidase family protein [Hymenobacter sp. YC55]|uniref:L,D-transpeptidase family protein n=1 Tax=Hymenobacter sp. YC55 TaxID=3034019 RepID=UPI0023F652AE|nr:L,D-transpeptidase family protein [Hymenobacter sp. YC55]MDF7811774.1 L,D-transpeptidase family protein [Hymenobacter sp. YC55]